MLKEAKPRVAPEYRESTMPMYQELIADDSQPAPSIFLEYSETDIDIARVPRSRYTDKAFFDLEIEHMWSKTWQMACREEQIAEVGDCTLYEGPAGSLILVRTGEDEIRAHYNACLHRGMRLCSGDTSVGSFRCPYHGFTWNLDGTIQKIPSRWDFRHVQKAELTLPQAKVARWNGFVFVNYDLNAAPLEDYIGRMNGDFQDWMRKDGYVAVHLRKVFKANWKACVEAFVEGFHVPETHAQGIAWAGDSSFQYDVWPDEPHVSRFLEPLGTPSDQMDPIPSEDQRLQDMYRMITGTDEDAPVPLGTRLRPYIAEVARQQMSKYEVTDYSGLSDTEALDGMQYSLFPNLILFRNLMHPYAYRFTPVPGHHDWTMYDFMIFKKKPNDDEIPETQFIDLEEDDLYADTGAFPAWLGEIYDQDCQALDALQKGLVAGGRDYVIFSQYQEVRCRHLHQTINSYLEKGGVDTSKI